MASAAPILAVGKSGQLGRCLFEAASRRDIRIIVVGRPDFDIENGETVERALTTLSPGIVINAAAYTAVDKAETEPGRCYAVNRDGARQVAAAAWRREIPFIHISTDYVFDGQKPFPYREDDPTAPLGVYGRSKLEGEQAVLAAHPDALILRTSWVYSAFGSNFLTTMLRLAQSRSSLRIVDDQHGCPTSAHALAVALLDISSKLLDLGSGRRTGIYHLSGSGQTTWHGLAAEIFARAKARGLQVPKLEAIPTAEYPTLAQRPANSRLDCAKVNRTFGVELPVWSDSVTDCVNRVIEKQEVQPC